ncbi:MAG: class I SAM-dependent methyltransferase [Marinoscillum sp.]
MHKQDSQTSKSLKSLRAIVDNSPFEFIDPKTGKTVNTSEKTLSKQVSSSHKFSYFLFRLINFMKYESVLETGTSLGINTSYLGKTNASRIVTIEGSKQIASRAESRFKKNQLTHIELVTGKVQEVFEATLRDTKPNLIFLDADHRSETIGYYLRIIKQSGLSVDCIVIHDIYWSKDMHGAWQKVIQDDDYSLTIDIFQAGIIFPDYPIEKQHFTLKF